MALEFYPNCAILSENKLPRYFFLYGRGGLGANFALLRGLCGQGLVLSPKIAVPMRTQVEPSSIATSKSCDMPMESTFMLYFCQIPSRDFISQFTQPAKIGSCFLRIVRKWRDGHEATEFQMIQTRRRPQQFFQLG